jgi:hypothetical protein
MNISGVDSLLIKHMTISNISDCINDMVYSDELSYQEFEKFLMKITQKFDPNTLLDLNMSYDENSRCGNLTNCKIKLLNCIMIMALDTAKIKLNEEMLIRCITSKNTCCAKLIYDKLKVENPKYSVLGEELKIFITNGTKIINMLLVDNNSIGLKFIHKLEPFTKNILSDLFTKYIFGIMSNHGNAFHGIRDNKSHIDTIKIVSSDLNIVACNAMFDWFEDTGVITNSVIYHTLHFMIDYAHNNEHNLGDKKTCSIVFLKYYLNRYQYRIGGHEYVEIYLKCRLPQKIRQTFVDIIFNDINITSYRQIPTEINKLFRMVSYYCTELCDKDNMTLIKNYLLHVHDIIDEYSIRDVFKNMFKCNVFYGDGCTLSDEEDVLVFDILNLLYDKYRDIIINDIIQFTKYLLDTWIKHKKYAQCLKIKWALAKPEVKNHFIIRKPDSESGAQSKKESTKEICQLCMKDTEYMFAKCNHPVCAECLPLCVDAINKFYCICVVCTAYDKKKVDFDEEEEEEEEEEEDEANE